MTDVPSILPTEIRAGDTARWQRSIPDYPASAGWALKYALVGNAAVHSFTASADGDLHQVTVPATTTAAWAAGSYKLQEFAEKDGERFTLSVVTLRVLPDLVASGGIDARTHARKVLDSIEAWLELKAPTAGAYEYNGRKLQNYPLTDLLALRDRYRAEVRREEAAARGPGGGRILTRF